jgi:hypothetical protein
MKLRWPFRHIGPYDELKRTAAIQEQEVREVIKQGDRIRIDAVRARVEVLRRSVDKQ